MATTTTTTFARLERGISPEGTFGYGGQSSLYPEVPLRRYIGGTLFLFASALLYWYWLAFPFLNTIFTHGYPRLGSPMALEFLSARYGWDWVHIYLLALNVLLPLSLAFAMTNNRVEEYTRLHAWFATLFMVINIWVVLVLSWRWLFYCNNAYTAMHSACNDYRYCCVFFPSSWCPNTAMCTPSVTSAVLQRNNEMLQNWAFGFAFFLLAVWNRSINSDLKEFGVLH
jgi:hypothetical protein